MFPLPVLVWRFMMNRRSSSFFAFHALQAIAVCVFDIAAGLIVLTTTVDPSSKPGQPGDTGIGGVCCACVVFLFLWLGVPLIAMQCVKGGRNLQIPGLAALLKRLL
jgi:hypothetical protein